MRIYNKQTLQLVGQTQHNTDLEWELEHNVIPNFGGVESDYTTIETDLPRFHLEDVDGVVITVEDGLTVYEQRQAILQQLEALDRSMNRTQENLIAYLAETQGYGPYKKDLELIAQKEALRIQLRDLV